MKVHGCAFINLLGFLTAVSKIKQDKGISATHGQGKEKITLHGHSENTMHTINEDEKESFVLHINQALEGDVHLGKRLPIDPFAMAIFYECKDGLLLAKLINDSCPGTIDERVLNVIKKVGGKLSVFQTVENNNVVINSAKAIGCRYASR